MDTAGSNDRAASSVSPLFRPIG